MDKGAIQRYAIWARNELIDQIKQRAYQYGISEDGFGEEHASVVSGHVLSPEERSQRQAFIEKIKEQGFQLAVEEVAYTWFNRFVALRFMEVNDYLPTHVRVFSDANGSFNPEILQDVLHLELEGLDKKKVSELLNANQTEELYRYLLLTQCNALNSALPEMFEKLGSYTEMLLPNNILKQESVLAHLVNDIDEDDWKDAVQIIGWMYQYYNTEPKQEVFDGLKKNKKITKDKIPAATQLFTPDWIVRYMVENSLGRLWLERLQRDIEASSEVSSSLSSQTNMTKIKALKANWKYYIDEAEQTPEVEEHLRELRAQSPANSPEDIKFIDPCMGSGHILVYAFDVLMQIYESEGYTRRDVTSLILEKNLHGLDIDRRAYQLAYFSLMMKARQYDRRVFSEGIKPQVYHPAGFPEGEEFGSLAKVDRLPPKPEESTEISILNENYEIQLNAWNFQRLLAQSYDVVATNPPYMGSGGMNPRLSDFVKDNYPDSKNDLFAVFIEKCFEVLLPSGYLAMITQHSWMFLSSYEKLRRKLLNRNIVNMAHLGTKAFDEIGGEVVQTTAFVLNRNNAKSYNATYIRLTDYNSQDKKESAFLTGDNRYIATRESFKQIPGYPLAYWVSKELLELFSRPTLSSTFDLSNCIQPGSSNEFLKLWFEINSTNIGWRWRFVSKGGTYRKWYGNIEYVLNYGHDGQLLLKHPSTILRTPEKYFSEGFVWTRISSSKPSFRHWTEEKLVTDAGPIIYCNDLNILGFLNSVIAERLLALMNPTINYQVGNIGNLPVPAKTELHTIVAENISLSRTDWDSFETSWDFVRHPLIPFKSGVGNAEISSGKWQWLIRDAFDSWSTCTDKRFEMTKNNEEDINHIFIDLYGLKDELTPAVEDKDIAIRLADLERDIKSLISYAVGCMFGRYSLDVEGLASAGGDWDPDRYKSFLPDPDNIIPISDDEYFDDDIVGRFVEFIRVVYGANTLEENLRFIADALGKKGTPREVIRSYFLNDFFKDHCKIYKKRPIYWLFDSGKKNGFKALVYLHRYQPDLLARLRTDYVHEQQERYRTQLAHISSALNTATGGERAQLLKKQNQLTEQLNELISFEEKIHHLADQNIEIDLDDGVKHNYTLFGDVLAKV